MNKPPATAGLHHIALFVTDVEACERFYVDLLGMQVEWRPDKDNVYLTSGSDNLALHRLPPDRSPYGVQRLDHIGFIINTPEAVDSWYEYLRSHCVSIKTMPKTHRDGARSFYCTDPAGTTLQLIYYSPLAIK
ncbi:glyoxalase/bleomycin resistance protein/dioxygenase [Candidatus Nitrosoglobus terrae]|uniref:Glyoxalase/bleomycin resistance protein/dioxygenase n=1 Tax=Candidatus Nitrosoglobus terrae TaxID=1630141 RepID=A0A1Q2SNZ1_9GAMM|nr:VOC family protein [Candidatus Nitrosoglobus terrae]BAW80817.1 glyoxalase/bleomycin resistance protein/dioxygenase [Candidatus Nitrosoglobus terrae]